MADTLEEARQYVHRNREIGVDCPCCGQKVRQKRYQMTSDISSALVWLVQASMLHKPEGWIHVPSEAPGWVITNRTYSKGKMWGLLEKHPRGVTERHKKTSGVWRPTSLGIDFVFDRVMIPEYVYTYRGKVISVSAEQISIHRSLGTKWDYQKLLEQYRTCYA